MTRVLHAVRTAAVFAFVFIFAPPIQATPLGTVFTYQGRLANGGSPASGLHDFRFRLYDLPTGGTQAGVTLCLDNVTVTGGLFSTSLDFGSAFTGEQRFLEIEVRADAGADCSSLSGFIILGPRQPLSAVPNALYASNSDRLGGLNASAFLQSVPMPLTLSGTSSTDIIHGANASTAAGSSGLHGKATASTGSSYGVFGESASTSGSGVFAVASAATGTTFGVFAQSASTSGLAVYGLASAGTGVNYGGRFEATSTSGVGVQGYAFATTGTTYGVRGQSASTSGRGVLGIASAATGTAYGVHGQSASTGGRGVYGESTATTGTSYGAYGQSASTSGRGVFGEATATSGATYGGRFESNSTSGRGIFGGAFASTGTTYGVYGQTSSPDGRGVYGLASAGSGDAFGLYGRSDSTTGYAVFGESTATSGVSYGARFENASPSGFGVYSVAIGAGGSAYGVMGAAPLSQLGYGVYAAGNLGSSGIKSFRIDHPDDPENRYLLHYSAESPDIINFYSGIITLNEAGQATVELPPYFARINKNPRYTLTAVGAPMPMLHVAQKIDEAALSDGAIAAPGAAAARCSFRIAGGAPGGEVSWRVDALRNDRWVQARGALVEIDKPESERGTYQHPDLYGQPPERGVSYRTPHQPTEEQPCSD